MAAQRARCGTQQELTRFQTGLLVAEVAAAQQDRLGSPYCTITCTAARLVFRNTPP
jgi:hypothetical protein